jgi:P-type E1-E2 ATPase
MLFVQAVAIFAACQAVLVITVGLARGLDPITVLVSGAVVVAVGNIPQGLPSTVTASLLIVAQQMGKQSVLVKRLDAVETLGACTVVCTDKVRSKNKSTVNE